MSGRETRPWAIVSAVAVWILVYFGARAWIDAVPFGSAAVYAAAALPVLPFIMVVVVVFRAFRAADELERRIQLEALALAFPLTMLLLMVLGLLETGMTLNRDDLGYRHIWGFLPLMYLGGLMLARRRYGQ